MLIHGLINHTDVQEVLRGRAERTVNHDSGQNLVDGWIGGSSNDARLALFTLFAATFLPVLLFKVATEGLGKRLGEVADNANVNRDVILLRSTERRST
jgi:hypothetical protein